MILRSLLAFTPDLLLGFGIVAWLLPGRLLEQLGLRAFLGLGVGLGASAGLYFFWSLAVGPENRAFAFVVLALAALFWGLALLRRGRIAPGRKIGRRGLSGTNWAALALALPLLVVGLMAARDFYVLSWMEPHGHFDAVAIWNLRARFIYRDPANWQRAFTPELLWTFHPDYPPLISLNVASGWFLLGADSTRVPIVQAGLFTFGLVGALATGLRRARSTGQGLLGALILLATPWIVTIGSYQTADIPLAYYIFGASLALYLAEVSGGRQGGWLAVSGLLAGFAAWTKNEGILFLVVLAAVRFGLGLLRRKRRDVARDLLPFAGGLLLPLAGLVTFKLLLPAPNDLFEPQTGGALLARLVDPTRYATIFQFIGQTLADFGGLKPAALVGLPLYALVALPALHRIPFRPAGRLGVILAGMAAGYFGIYLITPHPLVWHLETSIERLAIHLYPLALLSILAVTRTPEEMLDAVAGVIPSPLGAPPGHPHP